MGNTGQTAPNPSPPEGLHALLLLAVRGKPGGTTGATEAGGAGDQAGEIDPIALHFFRGLDRLMGTPELLGGAFHQLWTSAEELQLLFDANAIWIRSIPRRKRQKETIGTTEVASLTGPEKDLLRPYLWGGTPLAEAKTDDCQKVTWVQLTTPLGEVVSGLTNSNLRGTTSWLKFTVDGTNDPWEMALLLPRGAERREGVTAGLAAWLVDKSGAHCNALLAGLRALDLPFGMPSADRDDFWWIDRDKLIKEQETLDVRGLRTKYSQQIQSMHSILNLLHRSFSKQVRDVLGPSAAEPAIIFSYRNPNEDSIYFLPTKAQTEEFVTEQADVVPFLKFCRFGYPRDKALSGWVLSTGMSDYTENFLTDGRWEEWVDSGEQADIKEQLERVRRFLQRDRSLPNVYLVPIVMAQSKNGEGLETILMASISVAAPLPVEARRDIFNLAVRMRPTVEMALDSQRKIDIINEDWEKRPMTKKTTVEKVKDWLSTAGGILSLITGFAAVITLFYTLKTPPPAAKIIFGENPIPMSAMTLLATKGDYYARYHLAAESRKFPTGKDALDALVSGRAQFATVAETPLVLEALSQPNQKLAVVATMAESNAEMQLLINSDTIHDLKDLKGKRIATARETNADYFMDVFLRKNGIDPKQLTRVELKPGDMVNAFAKGSIDGYFIWQPFIYKGSHLQGMHTKTYAGSNYYTMTFNIVTSRDFATNHQKEVQEFLKGLKDAEDEMARDPAEGQEAVSDATEMDRDTIAALWPTYHFALKLDDSLVRDMNDELQWAIRSGEINVPPGTTPDLRGMIAPEALNAIKPEAVNLH